jgi:hypothetical protein
MPSIVYEIIDLFASILRFLGLAVFGLAGLLIAMAVFTTGGALGAVAAGIGVAVLIWGLPKKAKEEKED